MRASLAASSRLGVRSVLRTDAHMSRSGRWRRYDPKRKAERALATQAKTASQQGIMEGEVNYKDWSHEKLIERVTQLEVALKDKNLSLAPREPSPPPKKSWKKPRTERVFDPSKYNTRLVAFKLAYLGKKYSGFEHHTGQKNPVPTIEEELWKAFNKARLIFPMGPDGKAAHPLAPGEVNWDGCEYSKCGRTDKGVSAFGQVIGIRVRSNRPLGRNQKRDEADMEGEESIGSEFNTLPRRNSIEMQSPPLQPSKLKPTNTEPAHFDLSDPGYEETLNFDPIADEIPYCSLLNRLLPPEIRILAWCPAPPADFSARFSCRERQYRYFFTQPAFTPSPHHLEMPSLGKMKDGWLDIEAMREAAKLYEGEHDFRNFCKIDGGKQISNFKRTMFRADVEEVPDYTSSLGFVNGSDFLPQSVSGEGNPKVYTFTLHGSAFLWHQVRCMVAVLFLVAQGLEKPTIVSELLDVEKNPRRPTYEMASDTPLVLWDCVFPHENDSERKNALQWIYVGDGNNLGDAKYGTCGLMEDLWKVWRERKIDEMLAGTLMGVIAAQGEEVKDLTVREEKKGSRSQKVFDGGDVPRLQGTYTPVMRKPKMAAAEDVNEKYALRKGFESAADLKIRGFRRMNDPDRGVDGNVREEKEA